MVGRNQPAHRNTRPRPIQAEKTPGRRRSHDRVGLGGKAGPEAPVGWRVACPEHGDAALPATPTPSAPAPATARLQHQDARLRPSPESEAVNHAPPRGAAKGQVPELARARRAAAIGRSGSRSTRQVCSVRMSSGSRLHGSIMAAVTNIPVPRPPKSQAKSRASSSPSEHARSSARQSALVSM